MEPDIHPAYFSILFRLEQPLDALPAQFVIISAQATTGETWSAERNAAADVALRAELMRRGHAPLRITAYDPITLYAEPSWAVDLPIEEALDLGKAFLQDAIFTVQQDELVVAQCASRRTWPVGGFRERVKG